VDSDTGRVVHGPPLQVSRVFRGGKREARKVLEQLVHEVHEGHHVGTTATVGKLLDEWMKNVKRLGKASSTVDVYGIHVEHHIKPVLGTVRLDKLTVHTIDNYFASLKAKGLSARTIELDHSVLSAALSQGVDWGWLKSNPAKRAKRESAPDKPTKALTVAQLRKLYHAAIKDDIDTAMCIALGAVTGCRRGELLGLNSSLAHGSPRSGRSHALRRGSSVPPTLLTG
jgi:integrase